jgi:hypothetical protein
MRSPLNDALNRKWSEASATLEKLERELAAERERADRNQEDAERYRWLKDGVWDDRLTRIIELRMNAIWDAAIDAARRRK